MSEFKIDDSLRKHYDQCYSGENEWRRLVAIDKAANVVTLCTEVQHATVLEIGAGEGSLLQRLAELEFGQSLFALEISRSGVDVIENRGIPRLKECRLFDGYSIPYEDGRFDLAILSHVIEHVEHPRRLLAEAVRVARHVFVEVPLDDNWGLGYNYVETSLGHINVYTPKTIRHLIQSCHINVVREMVTQPSLPVYTYRKGKLRGNLSYAIKQALLSVTPRLATAMFTFHSSLLCRP